jgi:hypothetical protein
VTCSCQLPLDTCVTARSTDLETQAVEAQLYPSQLSELSFGAFTHEFFFNSIHNRSIYLEINETAVGPVNIRNIQHVQPALDTYNAPAQLVAGQPLTLQINTSTTYFGQLASLGTGWRVGLLRPDNSSADLGLMADWEVWQGVIYKWIMNVPGGYFQQVRKQGCDRLDMQ